MVYLRIGLVIGTDGGFITRMLTPFEFGLGGPLGSGKQWMSWIERDDLVRLIAHVIAKSDLAGPINATAPIPVTNTKFTEELGRRLRRPAIFRVPATLLRRLGEHGIVFKDLHSSESSLEEIFVSLVHADALPARMEGARA